MIAVVLAAGAGSRLGGVAKALLETGRGRSFIATVLATGAEAGVTRTIVVVAEPFASEVAIAANELGAEVVRNPHPERGMASSVAIGFRTAMAVAAEECEALLWPVDAPLATADTLLRMRRARGAMVAVVPTVLGRGGHPLLVGRSLWTALADCGELERGARSVLELHRRAVVRVEVGDLGVLTDFDHPQDLMSLGAPTW